MYLALHFNTHTNLHISKSEGTSINCMQIRGHQYQLYANHSQGIRKHVFAEDDVSLPRDVDFSTVSRHKQSLQSVNNFSQFYE